MHGFGVDEPVVVPGFFAGGTGAEVVGAGNGSRLEEGGVDVGSGELDFGRSDFFSDLRLGREEEGAMIHCLSYGI